MNTGIAGINLKIRDQTLVISSQRELRILSSAPLNGGLSISRTIINHHVPKEFHTLAPEHYLGKLLRKLALEQNTVGLMTAADVRNVSVANSNRSGVSLCVAVTAGTSNAMAAGDDPTHFRHIGTINTIILLDSNPTDACLVEIVKTATEAKSVALRQIDIVSHASNQTASGTSTDTVTVAATCRGKPLRFAGTATSFGCELSRNIVKALKDALRRQDKITPGRSVEVRLKEKGITSERIMKAASRRLHEKPSTQTRKRLILWKTSIRNILQRIDVAAVILASLKICGDASNSRIYTQIAKGTGSSIAYIIGGEAARLEFEKARCNGKRPLDFVFEGIVSGVVQNTLEKTRFE